MPATLDRTTEEEYLRLVRAFPLVSIKPDMTSNVIQ
jgi:hypothetical protein